MSARIAILASGGGSNAQALITHFAGPARAAGEIVWVGSNREDAGALQRARDAHLSVGVVRDPTDASALRAQLSDAGADLLVLAGYLKLVPAPIVAYFRGRILNVHPALLPAFGGEGMYGLHVHAAVVAAGAKISGATVHFVDEQYDRGAIAAQWPVRVFADDTAETLAARVLRVEHQLLPRTVAALASGTLSLGLDGRARGDVELPTFAAL